MILLLGSLLIKHDLGEEPCQSFICILSSMPFEFTILIPRLNLRFVKCVWNVDLVFILGMIALCVAASAVACLCIASARLFTRGTKPMPCYS